MTQITLDRETFEHYRAAGPAELLSPDGVPFATLTPVSAPPEGADDWTAEELAEIADRPPQPSRPAEDVYREIFGEGWRERYGLPKR